MHTYRLFIDGKWLDGPFTTRAVVSSILFIIIADAVFAVVTYVLDI